MTTPDLKFVPDEPLPQSDDGLIHGLTEVELKALGESCSEAKARAYCPYSLFRVGASLLVRSPSNSINIVTGSNIENASYPVGICAERTALSTALHADPSLHPNHPSSASGPAFRAIGVATDMLDFCSPCGMCRQFIREFCGEDIPVFMFDKEGKWRMRTVGQLLPGAFGPGSLPSREELKDVDKAKTA